MNCLHHRPWALFFLFLILTMNLGCSIPGLGQLTLFPEQSELIPQARALRQNIPGDIPRELQKSVLRSYVLEPGDVILVQAADLDSPVRLPGDQTIMADGTIVLGKYGQVMVAGMTVEQVGGAVTDLIKSQEKDAGKIIARLVSPASKVYYVLGDVNAPGSFPLAGRETVLDGIVAAGGLTQRASRRDILLARPTRPGESPIVFPVCYLQIVQLGDTTTNYQLMPGDRIFVPTRSVAEDIFGCNHRGSPCDTGTLSGIPCSGNPLGPPAPCNP